jgi:hypothetical protein
MQSIETEGPVQEISRAFTRTANPAEFQHIFWDDIQLVTNGNDLVGDGVMPASLA